MGWAGRGMPLMERQRPDPGQPRHWELSDERCRRRIKGVLEASLEGVERRAGPREPVFVCPHSSLSMWQGNGGTCS